MTIEFEREPFVKETPDGFISVCLNGRDKDNDQYVQCRVGASALSKSAGGITNEKLCQAFQLHRETIETAAKRHYASGNNQEENGHFVIWVNASDL